MQAWVGAPALPDRLPGLPVLGGRQHPREQPNAILRIASAIALLPLPALRQQPCQVPLVAAPAIHWD